MLTTGIGPMMAIGVQSSMEITVLSENSVARWNYSVTMSAA